MINAIIVDDEALAHRIVLHHLNEHPDIKIVCQCYNATEALAYLAGHSVDLMFLDINMPQLSGIELLKVLANRPQVVIISAHQEYALEGFDLEVTDYLLKPVSPERFAKAISKVNERNRNTNPTVDQSDEIHITLKVDRGVQKFALADIEYCEAYGNYVKVWHRNEMALVSSSLKALLEQLPKQQFSQIHKSTVINIRLLKSVSSDQVTLKSGKILRIGKSYKKLVKRLI